MFASQTRDLYHIETDRKGGYIEFAVRQIYRAERSEAYRQIAQPKPFFARGRGAFFGTSRRRPLQKNCRKHTRFMGDSFQFSLFLPQKASFL